MKIPIALLSILTTACVIGPKYRVPTAPVPSDYKEPFATIEGEWKAAHPGDTVERGPWWEAFNDRRLDDLEPRVDAANQTVAAAMADVMAARAQVKEARAQYAPAATVNPIITNTRLATGFGRSLGFTFTTYSLPVEASWEPDLWGRIHNTVAARRFAAQASLADLASVRLSAQAELATNYVELRGQDALKQVLHDAVDRYADALEITRARFTAGLESDEAVAQAETQLNAARAQDANVDLLRAQYEDAIAQLTGQPPSAVSIAADAGELTVPVPPLRMPSELLERRPDVAAAERNVAAANAQIGLAQTAFFPTLLLTATGGFEALSPAEWFAWPNRVWSVGPSLAQYVFDAGLRRATVQQYRAEYDRTVAVYRQTVLTAFQEIEDNLAALRVLNDVIRQQEAAIDSARRSLQEADVRYVSGLDPYLNVIAAQTILLNNQQAAVAFRTQRLVASVHLFRALGGGWDRSQIG